MSRTEWNAWCGGSERRAPRTTRLGVIEDLAPLAKLDAWLLLRHLRRLAETQARG